MICTIEKSNELFNKYKNMLIKQFEIDNQLRAKMVLMPQYTEGDLKNQLKIEINKLTEERTVINQALQLAAIDLDNFKVNVKIEAGIGFRNIED